MPLQKPLCRLCECPTADGAVSATLVDRDKLRNWAMKAMNLTEEDEFLPEKIKEDSLICHYCIWQAEFADESGDESVAWWPRKLKLDNTAKELRRNYSKGKVEQCWVQLEEVDLEAHANKKEKTPKTIIKSYGSNEKRECIYCGVKLCEISAHVRKAHKDAIKCSKCVTYFHTTEERDRHVEAGVHYRIYNPKLRCHLCSYVATKPFSLKLHLSGHNTQGNLLSCDECNSKFTSALILSQHKHRVHTFKPCKSCDMKVTRAYYAQHGSSKVCQWCHAQFACSGLYRKHLPADCRPRKSYGYKVPPGRKVYIGNYD